MEAKKLARFDSERLSRDKSATLNILGWAEQFPESEVKLRNANGEKPGKEEVNFKNKNKLENVVRLCPFSFEV